MADYRTLYTLTEVTAETGWVSPGDPYPLSGFASSGGVIEQNFAGIPPGASGVSVAFFPIATTPNSLWVEYVIESMPEFSGSISISITVGSAYVYLDVHNDGSWYLRNAGAGADDAWWDSAHVFAVGDTVRFVCDPTTGVSVLKNGSPISLGGMDTSYEGAVNHIELTLMGELTHQASLSGLTVGDILPTVTHAPTAFQVLNMRLAVEPNKDGGEGSTLGIDLTLQQTDSDVYSWSQSQESVQVAGVARLSSSTPVPTIPVSESLTAGGALTYANGDAITVVINT